MYLNAGYHLRNVLITFHGDLYLIRVYFADTCFVNRIFTNEKFTPQLKILWTSCKSKHIAGLESVWTGGKYIIDGNFYCPLKQQRGLSVTICKKMKISTILSKMQN